MTGYWKRAVTAVGLLTVVGSGIWTLAGIPQDGFPCPKLRHVCKREKCGDRPYPGVGLCVQADGTPSLLTVECCCCSAGWQDRTFIGD